MNMLTSTRTFQTLGLRSYFADKAQSLFFRFTLLLIDVGFALTQVRQWALARMGTTTGEGFEDILQRQVTVSLVSPGRGRNAR